MVAMLKLFVGVGRAFQKLNRALITMIPKHSEAEEVGDFRPIRACFFELSVAGCVGKAVVEGKLLCRQSCCFEFHCLTT
jgi:hypothetical protein